MTRTEFETCMKTMLEFVTMLTGKPAAPSTAALEFYYRQVQDLAAEHVGAAIERHFCESKYPTLPTPHQLRALVDEAINGAVPPPAAAWDRVMANVKRIGAGRYDVGRSWDEGLDELTLRAVGGRAGYEAICYADSETLSVLRGQFDRNYNDFAWKRSQRRALPEQHRPRIAHQRQTPAPPAMEQQSEPEEQSELVRLSVYVAEKLTAPEEPKLPRPTAKDRPAQRTREEQLRELAKRPKPKAEGAA